MQNTKIKIPLENIKFNSFIDALNASFNQIILDYYMNWSPNITFGVTNTDKKWVQPGFDCCDFTMQNGNRKTVRYYVQNASELYLKEKVLNHGEVCIYGAIPSVPGDDKIDLYLVSIKKFDSDSLEWPLTWILKDDLDILINHSLTGKSQGCTLNNPLELNIFPDWVDHLDPIMTIKTFDLNDSKFLFSNSYKCKIRGVTKRVPLTVLQIFEFFNNIFSASSQSKKFIFRGEEVPNRILPRPKISYLTNPYNNKIWNSDEPLIEPYPLPEIYKTDDLEENQRNSRIFSALIENDLDLEVGDLVLTNPKKNMKRRARK